MSVLSSASTSWQTAYTTISTSTAAGTVQQRQPRANAQPAPSMSARTPAPTFSYASAAAAPSRSAAPSPSPTSANGAGRASPAPSSASSVYYAPSQAHSSAARGWVGAHTVLREPTSSIQPRDKPASVRSSSQDPYSSDTGGETTDYESSSYAARTHSRTVDSRADSTYRSNSSATSEDEGPPPAPPAGGSGLLVRPPTAPPQVDNSGWASAFSAAYPNRYKQQREEADREQLAKDIAELGLDHNLNARPAPRAGVVGKYASPILPPPTSDSAWSFKKTLNVSKGSVVPPHVLRAPTSEYLSISARESRSQHPSMLKNKRPKLLILDLNNTLVARRKATSKGANNATPRPYLSNFLEYICGSELVDGQLQRRFNVMIWSSAQSDNVELMCENLCLFTNAGQQAPLLVDIWDRSSMDLTDEQYASNFPTVKDIGKVWKNLSWTPPTALRPPDAQEELSSTSSSSSANGDAEERGKAWRYNDVHWTQYDTILVDDSPDKACLQPHNHMQITPYKPHAKDAIADSRTSAFAPKDTALLQLAAMLEKLKSHSNVSAVIRHGIFSGLGRGPVGEEWAAKGRQVMISKGIALSENFDRQWADRTLGIAAKKKQGNAMYEAPVVSPAAVIGWD